MGGSKIAADSDCSHEIKRLLFLGRKVMTNLDSIFKSRDITLPTKVHLVKAMATHSSILAQRIPWTEELVGYSPRGLKELDMTEQLHRWFFQ